MTLEEAKEFFNRTKDLKIRISDWDKNSYFIPKSMTNFSPTSFAMMGEYHSLNLNGVVGFTPDCCASFSEGFSKNSWGTRWEFFNNNDEVKRKAPACTCGAKYTTNPTFHLHYCDLKDK
jgi:hypothetical protein